MTKMVINKNDDRTSVVHIERMDVTPAFKCKRYQAIDVIFGSCIAARRMAKLMMLLDGGGCWLLAAGTATTTTSTTARANALLSTT